MTVIALDPKQTFEFFLELELELPPARRTRFVSRFLTAGAWGRLDSLRDQAEQVESEEEEVRLLLEAINASLVRVVLPAKGEAAGAGGAGGIFVLGIQAALPEARKFMAVRLEREQLDALVAAALQATGSKRVALLVEAMGKIYPDVEKPEDSLSVDEMVELCVDAQRWARVAALTGAVPLAAGQLAGAELWGIANTIGNLSRLTEIQRKKSALRLASAARNRSVGGVGSVANA